MIGSFSADSNVTGVVTNPDPVTWLLKAHGALTVWGHTGAGSHLPIDMGAAERFVFSPWGHDYCADPAAACFRAA